MDQLTSADILVILQEVVSLVERSADLVTLDSPVSFNPFSVKE